MNMDWTLERVISELKSCENSENVAGMARFGINPDGTLGISIYVLRAIAKKIGKNHILALELWKSGFHEAKILASYIDDPKLVTEDQIEKWVLDFDSWDVCDQVCGLFEETSLAYKKVVDWSERPEEFVKRAAFVILARLAVHDKKETDDRFEKFFSVIESHAIDNRNFVKKAVNWALRSIGKRNRKLNVNAIDCARRIANIKSPSARWIALDALKELTDEKTLARIKT
jgi:3-methyladenine DNA glycosylase AlkD